MLAIQHVTVYRYARPVWLGTHRLMFRPRDSHDLRLLSSALTIDPSPLSIRWIHDVFGNSVAIAEFNCQASELRFQSNLVLEHFPLEYPWFEVDAYARNYPFSYADDEMPDLRATIARHYPDPDHLVEAWARQFVQPGPDDAVDANGLIATQTMLQRMMLAITNGFVYFIREEQGTQSPLETLEKKSGSCRDFALLMIEAVRSLGLAARFVSGYLYEPPGEDLPSVDVNVTGNGSTHAWVQVYLPGAGWVEFDPSNAIVGGKNLLRVAVARDISQAAPASGVWSGSPEDYLGMEVSVRVSRYEDISGAETSAPPEPSAPLQEMG